MVIVSETVRTLKGFIGKSGLNEFAMAMILRMVVAFISHQGRMSCSVAAGSIASEAVHRGQLTRFLARTRWQKCDFNDPLRLLLLHWEARQGASHDGGVGRGVDSWSAAAGRSGRGGAGRYRL